MKRVILESPFGANNVLKEQVKNVEYGYECCMDMLRHGEAPFGSHLFYPKFLNESLPHHRELGIAAGFAWGEVADLRAFYTDRGWSKGMLEALKRCVMKNYTVEFRSLTNQAGLPPPKPDYAPVKEQLPLNAPPATEPQDHTSMGLVLGSHRSNHDKTKD